MTRTTVAERLYRLVLRCYPGEFRDEYEREMLLAFRDRLDHDRRIGAGAVLRLCAQLLADSVWRAPGEHLDVLRHDVRYAGRSLGRAPLFALTAIATLALGIGSSTAMFSVVDAVALRPLAWDPDGRTVRIWEDNPSLALDGFAVSLPNYASWRERARTVELAAWSPGSVTLAGSGDPVHVASNSVSAGFFSVLRVTPVRGRVFTAEDEAAGAPPVALITTALWRSHFGGEESIIGRSVMAGRPYTIVGIVADDSLPTRAEFLTLLTFDPAKEDRSDRLAQVIGRMTPGTTLQQVRSEMVEIARQIENEFPQSNKGWSVTLSRAYDWVVPPATRRALYIVLASVCCVLLIACANVANLMLARASGRKREMALRLAIGAGRRRLVRQVLTEGILLTATGGSLGVLVAYWSLPALKQWLPASLPRAADASVSSSVLMFSVAVCAVTGLAFGALPALAGSRANVVEALKEGGRGTAGATTRWRQALAAAQVALATVLLVGAGLLVQTFQHLQRVDLGFDPANVTTAVMGLPEDRYKGDRVRGFYDRLLERLGGSPGVEGAAITSGAPFDGGNTGQPIEAVGPSRLEGKSLQADWRIVSPSYFKTLKIPLLRGNLFTGNTVADDRSLIVSATMARRIWGEGDAVGRQVKIEPIGTFNVIAVVGDVRNIDLAMEPAPTMYISTARFLSPAMTVIVRSRGPEVQAAALLRSTLRELDPQLAMFDVHTSAGQVDRSASQPRLNATLVAVFAVLAALLAALGIYGVLAYLVSQRRQEVGIRMALGARRVSVLRLFLVRALWLATIGVALGVAGALAMSRWIGSLMYDVSARDPWTFAAAGTLAGAIAIVASYVPARRAAKVDPLIALRAE